MKLHWLYPNWTLALAVIVLLTTPLATIGQQTKEADSSAAPKTEADDPPPGTVETPEAPPEYDIRTTKRLLGDVGGVRTDVEDFGIKFDPIFGGVFSINFKGGRNTANAHEFGGKAFHNITLDFDKMFGLEGGTFFFRAFQTFNDGVSEDIGTTNHPFFSLGSSGDRSIEIDKYWWRQRLFDDRLEFRLGMLDVGDTMDRNAYADNYLSQFSNRVFFLNRAIPYTKGIGVFLQVWPIDALYVQTYVADPNRDGDINRHGTSGFETAFHDDAEFRALWEFGVLPNQVFKDLLPGTYRFGGWYDPKTKPIFIDDLGGLRAEQTRTGDVGFYINFDQMLFKENADPADKQGLGVFGRYGYAHDDVNRVSQFWSAGTSYLGLIPTRDKDVLGFGVGQTIISEMYRDNIDPSADRETVYELYYAIHVTPWCIITPDVQWIDNPGGSQDVDDALVGGVRVRINF